MIHLLLAFLLAATSAAPTPAPIYTVKGELDDICGHVQGIACTDEAFYVAHMEGIYKLDWNGKLVTSAKGPSHIGGICVHDGRVYAPIIRREKASVVGDKKGMIKVYDSDLNPVSEHLYADGISSLVFFKDCFYGGLVEDKAPHATNRIARYGRDLQLKDIRPFDYGEPTKYGAQVLAVQGENLRMFFYSPNGAVLCDADLNVLAKGKFSASEGFARVPPSRSNGEELYLKVAAVGGNSRKWKKGTNPPQVRFVFVRPDGAVFR